LGRRSWLLGRGVRRSEANLGLPGGCGQGRPADGATRCRVGRGRSAL